MIKYFTLFILFSIFISSCDGPKRTRLIEETSTTTSESSSSGGSSFGSNGFRYINDFDNSSNLNGQTNLNNNPDQSSGCSITLSDHKSGIGYFGVCLNSSTSTEEVVRASFQTSDPSEGSCVLPMHKFSDGTSTILYNKAECVKPVGGEYYKAPFYSQNRLYSKDQYPINAVAVLKFSAVNHFYSCMFSLAITLYQNPSCASIPSCLATASAQANAICNDFLNIHGNKFKIVDLISN